MKDFTATVTGCRAEKDHWLVTLDNTAFYDTSGGQPYDTGTLGGAHVFNVEKKNGVTEHYVDAPLKVGSIVDGHIDWGRRFDHMCQHAADHMIAGMLWHHYGATTIGLHIGQDVSSIEVDMHGKPLRLSREEMDHIEELVMEQIQRDVKIRQWFPTSEELSVLPMRKEPTVSENIRIVMIGDYECVPCGGTHPDSAGQIGLIKILYCQSSHGNMRLFFLAGMRAYRYYQKLHSTANLVCERLSTNLEDLPAHLETVLQQRQQALYDLSVLQTKSAMAIADQLAESAASFGACRAAAHIFDQLPESALRDLASDLIDKNADLSVALFSRNEQKTIAVFACGSDVKTPMGNLLRQTVTPFGGRGGGKPNFAMGSLPADADLEQVKQAFFNGLTL